MLRSSDGLYRAWAATAAPVTGLQHEGLGSARSSIAQTGARTAASCSAPVHRWSVTTEACSKACAVAHPKGEIVSPPGEPPSFHGFSCALPSCSCCSAFSVHACAPWWQRLTSPAPGRRSLQAPSPSYSCHRPAPKQIQDKSKHLLHMQLLCGCCCSLQSMHTSIPVSNGRLQEGNVHSSRMAERRNEHLCCRNTPFGGLFLSALTTSARQRTSQWGCGCGTAACWTAAAASPAQGMPPESCAAAHWGEFVACPPAAARGGRA